MQVLSFRVDFYLPFANIIIEYDEKHHKSTETRYMEAREMFQYFDQLVKARAQQLAGERVQTARKH